GAGLRGRRAVGALAEAVHAGKVLGQEPDQQGARETDDVEVVAFDPLDERGAEPLDRVGTGAVAPLAASKVVRDVGVVERTEGDERRFGVELLPGSPPQAEPRDDLVLPARERLEHSASVLVVLGLPELLAATEDDGVDREHRAPAAVDGARLPRRVL